jgi:hypothetical protein
MVSISAGRGTKVRVMGHGLTVSEDFALAPGITVSPTTSGITDSFGSRSIGELRTQVTVLAMERLANFSILIEESRGGDALAVKAWNAL